jgi:hypothetical protein
MSRNRPDFRRACSVRTDLGFTILLELKCSDLGQTKVRAVHWKLVRLQGI